MEGWLRAPGRMWSTGFIAGGIHSGPLRRLPEGAGSLIWFQGLGQDCQPQREANCGHRRALCKAQALLGPGLCPLPRMVSVCPMQPGPTSSSAPAHPRPGPALAPAIWALVPAALQASSGRILKTSRHFSVSEGGDPRMVYHQPHQQCQGACGRGQSGATISNPVRGWRPHVCEPV